jgi:hypothetical protein
MEPYKFKPLQSNSDTIRLAILHRREPARPEGILASIVHVEFDKKWRDTYSHPDYHVVSYAHDGSEIKDIIVIDWGDDLSPTLPASARKLSVPANLVEALRHLPWPDRRIMVWADAICINQEDLEEKSAQVAMMDRIYSRARFVSAWIGPETEDSLSALVWISFIADSVKADWASRTFTPTPDTMPQATGIVAFTFKRYLDLDETLDLGGPLARKIMELVSRPWFKDLWGLHALSLSAKRGGGALICGKESIDWSRFLTAIGFLHAKPKHSWDPREPDWVSKVGPVAAIASITHMWLGDALRHAQAMEFADARDRVYAILANLPAYTESLAVHVKPRDYRKPAPTVYKELVLADIFKNSRADLLAECEPDQQDTTWRPTWVPNWGKHLDWKKEPNIDTFAAGPSCALAERGDGEGVLTIKGKAVAAVADVIAIPSPFGDFHTGTADEEVPAHVPWLKDIYRNLDMLEAYPGGSTNEDAFCYALAGSYVTEHLPAGNPSSHPSGVGSLAWTKKFLDHTTQYEPPPAEPIPPPTPNYVELARNHHLIKTRCNGRLFIMTEEGYFGLGPVAARSGDKVCVLLGCRRLMVLRAVDAKHYSVVGPCELHGLNWGEGLFGFIPNQFNLVWDPSRRFGGDTAVFENKQTQKVTVKDPRVNWGRLKKDKRRILDNGKTLECFKRPDDIYLAAKGVRLTSFHLM